MKILQALGRMGKGYAGEVAALTGHSQTVTENDLEDLKQLDMVAYQLRSKADCRKIRNAQLDLFPLWYITSKGLSLTLRSWGAPKGIELTSRLEKNRRQIGYGDRHIARLWPAFLKATWPQAEFGPDGAKCAFPGVQSSRMG